jgi:hypothetical protein
MSITNSHINTTGGASKETIIKSIQDDFAQRSVTSLISVSMMISPGKPMLMCIEENPSSLLQKVHYHTGLFHIKPGGCMPFDVHAKVLWIERCC